MDPRAAAGVAYHSCMAGSPLASHWTLDPEITFLNHGSFGACPRVVLEEQTRLRARMEAEPVRFFLRELEPLMDAALAAVGAFVGADPDDLAFVSNASSGVNAVLRSLVFAPGDELLTTDHAYNACRNALDHVAARAGARVVVAKLPFPLASADETIAPIVAAVTPRTKLCLLDAITSPTGLVLPTARIVRALADRGVDTLVDGAHAPGMIPLDLRALGAAYFTGNCHKWVCAPKGAAILHVRRDRQDGLVPTVVSHGANSPRTDRSRFRLLFDWTGTIDPTAALCIPAALRTVASLVPGGWPEVMAKNHALALRARDILCAALRVPPPAPDDMIGSLAAVPLPDTPPNERTSHSLLTTDVLQDALFTQGIEVPIIPWPGPPRRLVRVSAQLYNTPAQYEALGALLPRH